MYVVSACWSVSHLLYRQIRWSVLCSYTKPVALGSSLRWPSLCLPVSVLPSSLHTSALTKSSFIGPWQTIKKSELNKTKTNKQIKQTGRDDRWQKRCTLLNLQHRLPCLLPSPELETLVLIFEPGLPLTNDWSPLWFLSLLWSSWCEGWSKSVFQDITAWTLI